MRIAVVGSGYNGIANAALLSRNAEVKIVRTQKPDFYGCDKDFDSFCSADSVKAMLSDDSAINDADLVVITLPVSYDSDLNHCDTMEVEKYIALSMTKAKNADIVLRSDVPIGFTERINSRTNRKVLCFPDFSREGRAVYDTLNPTRLVISGDIDKAEKIAALFKGNNTDVPVFVTGSSEAESVKLFTNSYLAMRVAFFNELDTFAQTRGFCSADIIRCISMDPRVGDLYNNPSFAFGGKYLVEDSRKLKQNFRDIPEKIISMVTESNETRLDFIASEIISKGVETVGIYRMGMKTGSKDFSYSASSGLLRRLGAAGLKVIIYEPQIEIDRFMSAKVLNDFEAFKAQCGLIVANRLTPDLADVSDKVYSRDLFLRD